MDSECIGKWVAVGYSYAMYPAVAGGMDIHHVFGILESADDAALLILQPNGERAYVPVATVREFRVIEPAEMGPGGAMVRPAHAPAADSSIRPVESEANELVRPADGQSDP